MDTPSVKRLATNPLLLTILVLIYENVGKLPNRRAKLYETCTQTLLESWRQEQTERKRSYDDLARERADRDARGSGPGVLAARTLSWRRGAARRVRDQLRAILMQEMKAMSRMTRRKSPDRLLDYANCEAGLLCERGRGATASST